MSIVTGRDLIDDPIIDKIVSDKGPFDLPSTDTQTIREVNVISEFKINENGYHLDPEIKEKHTAHRKPDQKRRYCQRARNRIQFHIETT